MTQQTAVGHDLGQRPLQLELGLFFHQHIPLND